MNCRQVNVSCLTCDEMDRLKIVLDHLLKHSIKAPTWRVVSVKGASNRVAPGARMLVKKLGPEAFDLFSVLVSVGIDAYKDSKRTDLTGPQKIGRTSLNILLAATGLELVFFGVSVMYPDKVDYMKNWLFDQGSPHINWISNQIVKIGGQSFQNWSSQPHWDFI